VIRQTKVVVGAKIQDSLTGMELYFGILRRTDDALSLIQTSGFNVSQLFFQQGL
jgi:hypothetical protein